MLYNAPEQCISTKCTVPRTGNKVRKCVKWWLFSVPNFRTHESIGKQIKNTRLGDFEVSLGTLCLCGIRKSLCLLIVAGQLKQFTN